MKIVYVVRDMYIGGHLSLINYYSKYYSENHEIIILSSLPFDIKDDLYQKIINNKNIKIIQGTKLELAFIEYISFILSILLLIPRKILYKLRLRNNDVKISDFKLNIFKKIGYFLFYSKLIFVDKKFKPDVFHSIGFRLESQRLINFLKNRKFIYSELEDPINRVSQLKYENLKDIYIKKFKFFLDNCTNIIVPSNIIKNQLLSICNINEKNIEVIPWIIDQDFTINNKEVNNDNVIFGALGRLELIKGFDLLIEAFSKIQQTNWQLYISGDGTQKENLNLLIEKYNLSDNIKLIGWNNDKSSFFNEIDVFIHPSLSEGMPLVIIEAMLFKKPVIATSVGSIPEMFDKSGFLIPPNNIDRLRGSINKFIENKDLIKEMSDISSIEFNNKFSLNILISQLENIYKDI